MRKIAIPLVYLFGVLFSMEACRKSPGPTFNPPTPIQLLINNDTTLSLFHRMLLVANETNLLADNSVTLLIPTNTAFRAAGFSQNLIDSMAPSTADLIISYHFITQTALPNSSVYTAFPTHLGYSIYGEKDSTKQIWFNGAPTVGDTTMAGKAVIYRMSSVLLSPQDSLVHTLAQDSTLSFAAELFRRTGLDTTLTTGNFMVLAPTNAAFINAGYDSVGQIDSTDPGILVPMAKFHVVPGIYFSNSLIGVNSLVTLQGGALAVSSSGGPLQFKGSGNSVPANVLIANQPAANSFVIYKIDELLSP